MRRRKMSAGQWRNLITEQQTTRQEIKKFCIERSLTTSVFFKWRRRLNLVPSSLASGTMEATPAISQTVKVIGAESAPDTSENQKRLEETTSRIISSDAKDKKLSKGMKQKLMKEQDESGISVAEFCRIRGLSDSTFSYWKKIRDKKKVAKEKPSSQFTEVIVKAPELKPELNGSGITLNVGKASITVERDFDKQTLINLMEIL